MGLLERFNRIDKALGVSVHIAQDGSAVITACGIVIKGSQLTIEKKIGDISKAAELIKHADEKTPVALNISGKGVLIKQLDGDGTFTSALPNANPVDFYIQPFNSGDKQFLSVIRRQDADAWITQLIELKLDPLMLSLGPFAVDTILPQLNAYGCKMVFNGHVIEREDHTWLSYSYQPGLTSPFPYKIESEQISESLLMPYAAAFQLALHDKTTPVAAAVPLLDERLKKVIGDKKTKAIAGLVLAVFFVILLGNFTIFSSLNAENAQLAQQASLSAKQTGDLESLAAKSAQQEQRLKNLGWEGGISKSRLIDELAAILPNTVTWTSVEVDPVNAKAARDMHMLKFEDRRIVVKGHTDRLLDLNEWIAVIKTKKWVKKVTLENYDFNAEQRSGLFTVNISY